MLGGVTEERRRDTRQMSRLVWGTGGSCNDCIVAYTPNRLHRRPPPPPSLKTPFSRALSGIHCGEDLLHLLASTHQLLLPRDSSSACSL